MNPSGYTYTKCTTDGTMKRVQIEVVEFSSSDEEAITS